MSRFLILALLFLVSICARASDEQWSEMDKISDYNPKKAIEEGKQAVQIARIGRRAAGYFAS